MHKKTKDALLTLDPVQIKDLYWAKGNNVGEIAKQLGVSVWSLYGFMDKNNIARRSYSEANFLVHKDKPQFKVKTELTSAEEKLRIAGIMLYWAEGTLKGSTVDFANSDPRMIKIFMKFLREICGVCEERLRLYLYAYPYMDMNEVKVFWQDVTKIPQNQFTKPYIGKGNSDINKRKLAHGLVHIRYNDKKLLEMIGGWIREYAEKLR
jgi:hypothetical protein